MQINKNRCIGLIGVVLTQIMFMSNAQSEIFKCTNSKGEVYYNDKHCPVKDKEQKIKAVKDVVNGYSPPVLMKNKKLLKAKEKVESSNQNDNREREIVAKNTAKNKQTLNSAQNMQVEDKKYSPSISSNTAQAAIKKVGRSSGSEAVDKKELLSLEEQEQLFIQMHAGEISEPR